MDASPEDSSTSPIPVHIYPFDQSDYKSVEKDLNRKSLHFIRHAEGRHNVNQRYHDLDNLDAPLTELGIGQCRALSEELRIKGFLSDTSDILIVTSPLTRCLQTTLYALDTIIAAKQPPIVALECVRETVNFSCDRRTFTSSLAQLFPMVDFSHMESDDDPIWTHYEERLGDHLAYTKHRESAELHKVAERGRQFFQWLRLQPQSHVIVCTHSAFLRCITNYGYGVPFKPEQLLDDRDESEHGPVIQYHCPEFGSAIRANYANCELRSMTATFT